MKSSSESPNNGVGNPFRGLVEVESPVRNALVRTRMRILHVISQIDAKGGGPAVALLGLAIAQREAGLDVAVVSTFRDGEDNSSAETMRARGIDVRLVGPAVGALSRHPKLKWTLGET